MTTGNLTVALARYCRSADHDALGDQARDIAKRSILDTLACLMAGVASSEWPHVVTGLGLTEAGAAPVFGTRLRADKHISALANGTAAHMDSFDDYVVRAGGHSGVSVIPAALAAAPSGTTGKDLIAAVVAGYEVMTMFGDRMARASFERGHHATGTHGAVAASAAAARVAGLAEKALADAIGLGASQSSGLRVQFGSMAKPFQAGHAAMAGALSASLAAAGFTPSADPIGGVRGLVTAVAGEAERSRIVEELLQLTARPPGELLVESPPTTKLHASCGSTHSAVDCAIELGRQLDRATLTRVRHIDISLPTKALATLVHHRPTTGLQAKYSVEFAVASGLFFGDAGRNRFVDAVVGDPLLKALTHAGEVHDEPAFQLRRESDKFGGALPARVVITLPERTLEAEVIHPLGSAQRPLAWEQVAQKFAEHADPVIGSAKASAAVAAIARLEDIGDVRDDLLPLLIPA